MRSIKLFSFMVPGLMALSAALCAAQYPAPRAGKEAKRILPPPAEISSPFAMAAPSSQAADSIAFVDADSMTAQDQDQVRDAEPAIHRKAALQGFDFAKGSWTYQQIACPVFPGQILLLYTRDGGVGDVSKFSAIVPRDGNGAVQVLPLLRRSYSLFTSARVNPMTIAAFNILREHEHLDRKVDWLATGLCYAALTGARVALSRGENHNARQPTLPATNALLQVNVDGSAVVRFFNVEDPQHVESWALTFDRHGKLMSVLVTPLAGFKATMLP